MTVYFYCKVCKKKRIDEKFKDDTCRSCRILKLDKKNHQEVTLINKKWS